MKLSYYTITVDIPTGKVFYNTMYKNIAERTHDECGWFENLMNNAFRPTRQEEVGLLESLTQQMFVVEDDMDESAYFQLGWNRSVCTPQASSATPYYQTYLVTLTVRTASKTRQESS